MHLPSTMLSPPHILVQVLPVYYGLGVVGEPQHTGARSWPRFRAWFSSRLEPSLLHYFGSVKV